jgi:hypothetical protein
MSALDPGFDPDDGAAFAAAVAPYAYSLGGGFMISPQAKAMAKELGLRGRQGYVVGRGGVLGDVDADVVTAAFGFWPADVVRESWEAARALVQPSVAAQRYAEACRDWGREHYAGMAADARARLAELLGWVVDGCDVAGLPLFAGWRAIELPRDDSERLAQLLHVHREYRGGAHVLAVVATGLTPLQSVLSGPGGPGNATFYGWPEPFEDVSALGSLRAQAEALTDRLVAPSYDVLGRDERLELLDLLAAATHAAA